MSDEYVILVDEDNRPIGKARKADVHTGNTPLHRAFSVFLFDSQGELLLQQRSHHKKTWPLVWSNSCCGHPQPGEETVAAAHRRLKEELRLSVPELWEVLPDFRYRAELDGIVEYEICPVWIGFTDQEPNLNPKEIEAVRWVPWQEFQQEAAAVDSPYSPWCKEQTAQLSRNGLFERIFREHTSNSQ